MTTLYYTDACEIYERNKLEGDSIIYKSMNKSKRILYTVQKTY